MSPLASAIDLIVFLVLLFGMDMNFLAAFVLSSLVGFGVDFVIKRNA